MSKRTNPAAAITTLTAVSLPPGLASAHDAARLIGPDGTRVTCVQEVER